MSHSIRQLLSRRFVARQVRTALASRVHSTRWIFWLNDHQKLIRATVRQFMKNEVRPSVSGNGGVTGAGGDKFCQVPNGHVS
jgi:hypothetical protein